MILIRKHVLAYAIEEVTDAIAVSNDLSDEVRKESLTMLRELVRQLTMVESSREKASLLKATADAISGGLAADPSVAQIWATSGQIIRNALGV